MADRESEFVAMIGSGVGSVDPADWDGLAGYSDPFLSHAFLSALEESGSVGPGTGWSPAPILIQEDGVLTAAMPTYLKSHSQGEYVFDHGWAEAFQRAGGAYYPKLQSAVPFTPVPGRRLLGSRPQQLLATAEAVIAQHGLSSAHITFLSEGDAAQAEARGWLIREGIQYHWFNRDYVSFDDFLGALSSRKRKQIRKERAAAKGCLTFETLRGAEIGPDDWNAMWAFYQDTGSRKWGSPYLTKGFFDCIAATMADRLLLFLAKRDGRPIAGALNLIGDDALYGRYWGALEEVPFLHFELCYYRAIEWAIDHGLAQVQAGAQGEHKLARGYVPVITRSAHFLATPGLREAVKRYVDGERVAIADEARWLAEALPYRSSASE